MIEAPVSVVVPVRNESKTLPALLAGLAAQTRPPRELILADAASDDGSRSIAQDWWNAHGWAGGRLVLLELPLGFPGAGRNAGVEASHEPWIAFIDAGIVPEPRWLESLLDRADTRDCEAVIGVCEFDADGAWERAFCALSYGVGTVRPVLPASMFRRELFERVGRFDGRLRAGEDTLWLSALERAGIRKAIAADARVAYRRFPPALGAAARKWFEYERHVAAGDVGGGRRRALAIAPLLLLLVPLASGTAAAGLWAAYLLLRGVADPIRRSARREWWSGSPAAPLAALIAAPVMDLSRALGAIAGLLARGGAGK